MAFMGLMVAGVVLVILAVVFIIVVITAITFFIIGLVTFIRDKNRRAYALATEGVAPKRKKYPIVFMVLGLIVLVPLALYMIISPFVVAYEREQYRQELFWCLEHESDLRYAQKLIDEGKASPDCTRDSNAEASADEETLLMWYCKVNNYDDENLKQIEFLIENGADIDRPDPVNNHAPDDPSHSGDAEHGYEFICGCGMTVLERAASNGSVETVKLLIENGADVNAENYSGKTPLMYAATSLKGEDSVIITELLIENGADVNAVDNFGQSALDHALYFDHPGVISTLQWHGAVTSSQLEWEEEWREFMEENAE